jgi:hypothetical protein
MLQELSASYKVMLAFTETKAIMILIELYLEVLLTIIYICKKVVLFSAVKLIYMTD